jgi:cell division inhibitor SepF
VLHLVTSDSPRGEHLTVESFDDLEAVGEAFRAGARVTADLRCSDQVLRRAIDFMSGLAYALDGSIERAADRVFLLIPNERDTAATA